MTAKTRTALQTDVNTELASGQTDGITALQHRGVLTSVLDSAVWAQRTVSGTSHTLNQDDANSVIRCTSASAVTITTPDTTVSPTVTYPAATRFLIEAVRAAVSIADTISPTPVVSADGLTIAAGKAGLLVYNGTGYTLYHLGAGAAASDNFTMVIAASDETTALTTGTAKTTFRMPAAVTLTAVRASLTTANTAVSPVTGPVTVDINESGSSILSTKLTIDDGEKTSTTAATAAVISDSSLADDAEMTIDIDVAGSDAAGLKVTLIGTYT